MYREIGKRVNRAFRRDRVARVLLDALDSGPFDGGCLVVAKALARLFPECKVATVVRRACGMEIPDHYAVTCPDGGMIDADGYAPTPQAFLGRFVKNEHSGDRPASFRVKRRMLEPFSDIDDPRAVEDLARELGTVLFRQEPEKRKRRKGRSRP